jgi:hypothetical protein
MDVGVTGWLWGIEISRLVDFCGRVAISKVIYQVSSSLLILMETFTMEDGGMERRMDEEYNTLPMELVTRDR